VLALASLLLFCTGTADAQEGLHPFLRVETRNYSEPVSVREAFDQLEADGFDGGENAFTHTEIEAGFRFVGLQVFAPLEVFLGAVGVGNFGQQRIVIFK
jgi:hypothetical protein